jgi:hypothetical protein
MTSPNPVYNRALRSLDSYLKDTSDRSTVTSNREDYDSASDTSLGSTTEGFKLKYDSSQEHWDNSQIPYPF